MPKSASSESTPRQVGPITAFKVRYIKLGAGGALRIGLARPGAGLVGVHVVADDAVMPSVDPHKHLESRDMLRRVEAAMLRLPDKTRQIFIAHRIEGLSYAEIAEQTGLSVKGVEKQMSKALVALDRLIARS